MLRSPLASLLVVVPLLAGCAGMPLTTMIKLHKVDPMEVDPAQLKVAIRTDERIGIRKDGAHISLKFDAEDGSLHIDDTYVIEIIRDPILTSELFDDRKSGKSVTVLQLSDSDAQKMTRAQVLLRPYSEGGGSGSLSLGVVLHGVCAHSPIPAGKVLVDIFMQARDNDGFFTFTRDLDLRESSDGADAMFESLPKCVESPITSERNETAIPLSVRSGARVDVR